MCLPFGRMLNEKRAPVGALSNTDLRVGLKPGPASPGNYYMMFVTATRR